MFICERAIAKGYCEPLPFEERLDGVTFWLLEANSATVLLKPLLSPAPPYVV